MPSLSLWDKGKSMEGRRYLADVEAGNEGFALLCAPLEQLQDRQRRFKERIYRPRLVKLRGNHEDRIRRAANDDPKLDGTIGLHHLDTRGWEVVDFLVPITIDGIVYAHYFYNPMSGRPYGGNATTRLKTIGHSFTMGHQQTLDYAVRFVAGKAQHALIAGACYLHDEDYKGPQGNSHWRGVIVCHEVADGSYDPMFVSMEYLCRRYEGVSLSEFQR